jgi:hypothetical protein
MHDKTLGVGQPSQAGSRGDQWLLRPGSANAYHHAFWRRGGCLHGIGEWFFADICAHAARPMYRAASRPITLPSGRIARRTLDRHTKSSPASRRDRHPRSSLPQADSHCIARHPSGTVSRDVHDPENEVGTTLQMLCLGLDIKCRFQQTCNVAPLGSVEAAGVHLQMLGEGPEHVGGEVDQASDDDDDAEQKGHEQAVVRRKGTRRGRDYLL